MLKLRRLSQTPVITPKSKNAWEASAVFNCAVIYDRRLIHMIYRATNIPSNGKVGPYINNLGYAVSTDGVTFNRLEHPVLENDLDQEARGPEDPRIVKLGDLFYMLYTGYGGRFDGDYRICLATSPNLISWDRKGVLLDETNKDATLFPELIGGHYLMLHRRPPDIWLAVSDDLKQWHDHQIIMRPSTEPGWESEKIGVAGPPIATSIGWLLIYHGVSPDRHYSLGAALLDRDDPSKILTRQKKPILEPELEWEVQGHVPNVVFSCGQVVLEDRLIVYYGGADTAIGAAELDLKSLDLE